MSNEGSNKYLYIITTIFIICLIYIFVNSEFNVKDDIGKQVLINGVKIKSIETKITKINNLLRTIKLNQETDNKVNDFENNAKLSIEEKKEHKEVNSKNNNTNNVSLGFSEEYDTYSEEQKNHEHSPQRRALEKRFLSEPVDYIWAPQEEKKIKNIIAKKEFRGNKLKYNVCKTKLCKITVEHEYEIALDVFFNNIDNFLEYEGGSVMTTTTNKEGKEVTTMFYTRSGKLDDNMY